MIRAIGMKSIQQKLENKEYLLIAQEHVQQKLNRDYRAEKLISLLLPLSTPNNASLMVIKEKK